MIICSLFVVQKLRRSQWRPTPVLLPGKSHGQRSLVGYSPWGHKESDTTEWLHFTSVCEYFEIVKVWEMASSNVQLIINLWKYELMDSYSIWCYSLLLFLIISSWFQPVGAFSGSLLWPWMCLHYSWALVYDIARWPGIALYFPCPALDSVIASRSPFKGELHLVNKIWVLGILNTDTQTHTHCDVNSMC